MKTVLKIVASLVVVGVTVVGTGRFLFRRKTEKVLAQHETEKPVDAPDNNVPNPLPAAVSNYLRLVMSSGRFVGNRIKLQQRGKIQIQKGKWTPFTATQHIFAMCPGLAWPGFIWTANLFPIYVHDSFLNGKGETLVSLLGLKTIERSVGQEMNQGALQRYISELCWFPGAFLENRLSWKELTHNVVEATMSLEGVSASGVFTFDDMGLIRQFDAMRYQSQNGTYRLARWRVTVGDYQTFAGIRVPTTAVATWLLPEGDFDAIRMKLVMYDAHPVN